ncbi:(2Fe-2S)-binding protein [Ferrovibrio sp. MS7]|jgi:bacterioferritin-associated ferredoxin|uniref:(2Fe-2S)-binding protein n=1 Tax=Ferrovibrio plantarum TaxID=3119164 RepID=UPI001B4AFD81|nr:(2Fe-2S)-binding protein [Ferrovibrio sp.]
MYVCLCHGLTERDVRGAIDQGCRSVASVYKHLAEKPQCGKCVGDVRCMIRAACNTNHNASHAVPLGAVAQAEA